MTASPRPVPLIVSIGLVLAILFVGWFGYYLLLPPNPLPATAPPTEFSAERALVYDRAVASVPHPGGSPANEKVRQYIYDTLRSLGVDAELYSNLFVHGHHVGVGNCVLGRIPGTANTKAFMMEAHYDSVAFGPGAADDCSGVSAMLEIARALKASPPLKNDVIFVFSDMEETGAMGAQAFTEHAWSKDVGILLGFEARGNRGPALMFETSPENGWLIAEMIKARCHAVASSLMFDVYKRSPFDSDFSVFKRAGFKGFNVAFVDNFAHYHTKNDNPDNLSLATLQHDGAYGLGLARHFGNMTLGNVTAPDAMYFNVIGSCMVHYPLTWAWPLTILTGIVFLAVLIFGLVRRHLSLSGILGGFALFLVAALLVAITTLILLAMVYGPQKLLPLYTRDFTHLPDLVALYHNNVYGWGFVAAAIAVLALFYGCAFRFVRVQNLMAGALLWWLLGLLAVTKLMPGGNFMIQWPLLFSALGLALLFLARDPDAVPLGLTIPQTLFAVPVLFLVIPSFPAFLSMVMIIAAPGLVLIFVLVTGLLLPQLEVVLRSHKWWLPVTSAALAIGLIAFGLCNSSYTTLRPKLNSVSYGLDRDANQAFWISNDAAPDEWTSQFFPAGTARQPVRDFLPGCGALMLRAPAPVASSLPGAQITVVSDTLREGIREMVLRIESPAQAATLDFNVASDTKVHSASLFGKSIDGGGKGWGLGFNPFPREGAELTLRVDPGSALRVNTIEHLYGLPDVPGIRPRPDYMAPLPNTICRRFPIHDGNIFVTRSFTFPSKGAGTPAPGNG